MNEQRHWAPGAAWANLRASQRGKSINNSKSLTSPVCTAPSPKSHRRKITTPSNQLL